MVTMLFSNNRTPLGIIFSVANTADFTYTFSCFDDFYDAEKCEILLHYKQHKSIIVNKALIWLIFLIVVSFIIYV